MCFSIKKCKIEKKSIIIKIGDGEKKHRTFFLSRAGTGKSTLIKEIVRRTCQGKKKYHLYLINVDGKDTSEYKKMIPKLHSIEFKDLDTATKKSCIIVEDIIHISKKDEEKLRFAINYQAHHKTQKIICASHSIYKTKIFSLLNYFNFIIFTSAIANIPTLRNIFNYFKVEKTEIGRWLNFYSEFGEGKKGIYFYFDCEKITFNVSKKMLFKMCKSLQTENSELAKNDGGSGSKVKVLQSIFNKFIENLPEKNEAIAIFSVISNCVPNNLIREQDLTIMFRDKKNAQKKLISIVDYVISLLSPELIVGPPLIAMHRFIRNFCQIPQVFIRNKAFS